MGIAYSVASHIAGFQTMANAIHPEARLSEQAVSIPRQMNEAGASRFIQMNSDGTIFQMMSDDRRDWIVSEPRFIDDDLRTLCKLGLLILSFGSAGSPIYTITRAGAAVGNSAPTPGNAAAPARPIYVGRHFIAHDLLVVAATKPLRRR